MTDTSVQITMNGLRFNGAAVDGVEWTCAEVNGLGGAGVRYESGGRVQADGQWSTKSYRTGQAVGLSGMCEFGSAADMPALIEQLNAAVALTEVPLTMHWPSGDRTRTVKRDGGVEIGAHTDRWFAWSCTVVADDPHWYAGGPAAPIGPGLPVPPSADVVSASTGLPSSSGGLTLPLASDSPPRPIWDDQFTTDVSGWSAFSAGATGSWQPPGVLQIPSTGDGVIVANWSVTNGNYVPGTAFEIKVRMRILSTTATSVVGPYTTINFGGTTVTANNDGWAHPVGEWGDFTAVGVVPTSFNPATQTGNLRIGMRFANDGASTIEVDSVVVTEPQPPTGGGITVPFSIGATVVSGDIMISTVAGGWWALVIESQQSSLLNPRLIFTDPDGVSRTLAWNLELHAGEFLVIDPAGKTSLLQGQAPRVPTVRQWPTLTPGDMLVQFRADNYVTATATVYWVPFA